MKTLLQILLVSVLLSQSLFGADTILDALQKGLLEEEANQNFEAAILAYKTVIRQSEDQRKIAATAVFRLGECYRKLGKTNEAAAQYHQVLREYPDQSVLVNISRQNISALGMAASASVSDTNRTVSAIVTSEEEQEIKRIQAMIRNSPDLVNAFGPDDPPSARGQTPLHKAAKKGQLLVAGFLLDNGADLNARAQRGFTPLHLAAENGHKAMVELLLSKGADIDATNDEDSTPLEIAVYRGYRVVAKTLLDKGANVNGDAKRKGASPLWFAVTYQDPAMVKLLLEAQADVNATNEKLQNETCLMAAAIRSKAMVELLLAKGVVVDGVDLNENSALMKAAAAENTEIVDLLLRHKANPNQRSKQEVTPLMLAIQANDDVMLKSLLGAGADANLSGRYELRTKDQPTTVLFNGVVPPLAAAVLQDNPEIVDILTKHKADLNARFDRGGRYVRTALIEAILKRNLKICRLLLEGGANVQEADESGLTPLHLAVIGTSKNRDIIALLLQHKADPNAEAPSGETPLDLAKRNQSPNIMTHATSGLQPTPSMPVPPTPVRMLPGVPVPPSPPRRSVPAGQQDKQTSPQEDDIVNLLRQAGANEHRQRLQAIWISRPTRQLNIQWFLKGTNMHNRFSLGEFILKCFEYPEDRYKSFADLSQLTLRRLDPATGQEKIIPIDFDAILTKGDPESDIRLEWGDIVEIPEADHLVNERWLGPKHEWVVGLNKIFQAYVQVVVRGQTNHLILKPRLHTSTDPVTIDLSAAGDMTLHGQPGGKGVLSLDLSFHVLQRIPKPVQSIKMVPVFWLYSVLREAGVIRASSDLSRVKVTRENPSTGQYTTMVFDSREQDLVNDLWLRNGDVIEIPDKD